MTNLHHTTRRTLLASLAVAAAVAQTLLAERASEGKDPFSRRDGWRPHGLTVRRFDFEYLGEAMQASLTYLHDGALQLALGEVSGLLTFHALPAENGTLMDLRFMGQRQTVQTWQREEIVHIFCALGATQITELDALAHAGEAAHDVGRLTAPMPGKVVSFSVKAGDVLIRLGAGEIPRGLGLHQLALRQFHRRSSSR